MLYNVLNDTMIYIMKNLLHATRRYSRISEAYASEILENLEEMFSRIQNAELA